MVSFIGGGNGSTRRKLSTCRKSLTNFYHIMLYRQISEAFIMLKDHSFKHFTQFILTYGTVICVTPSLINNKSFEHILISRRCIYRAGTRFWVRGIDSEGQVANFVETEQIIQFENTRCSYVQVDIVFLLLLDSVLMPHSLILETLPQRSNRLHFK